MHPLEKLCNDLCIEVDFNQIEERSDKGSWGKGAKHYAAVVRYNDREMRTEYTIGSAIKKPKREDLISSLVSDYQAGQLSFEDFCDGFGYDTDSRRAYATWGACSVIKHKVEKLFGSKLSELEQACVDY